MTASLHIKNGIYQIIYSWKDSSGKWRQKSETTGLKEKGNKRRAEAITKDRLNALDSENVHLLETSSIHFLDAMENWLNDVMTAQVRRNTLDEYKRAFAYHIKTYQHFQGLKLQDLSPRILQEYYNAKFKSGLSPNTIHKQHANINKFLNYATSLDMIARNPAKRVVVPAKVKSKVPHFYSAEQLQELMHAFWGDAIESVVFWQPPLDCGAVKCVACGGTPLTLPTGNYIHRSDKKRIKPKGSPHERGHVYVPSASKGRPRENAKTDGSVLHGISICLHNKRRDPYQPRFCITSFPAGSKSPLPSSYQVP